jgi:hypothetical protein
MAGCGRRFAVRAGAACFAAVLGAGSTALATEAAAKQLQITVQVGYHNTVKLGQWAPVTVDLTNSGPDVNGVLEVQAASNTGNGGPPIGAATYQTPISLASGATKHVRTYVTQDVPGTVAVRVVQNGQVVASQESSVSNTYSSLMAGVISDQPSALDSLAIVRSGLSPLVVHLIPAELSDSAPVLRAFDLLAVDDFATDTLTGAQRNALTDYVMQGGALLLGTGGSWHKTVAGLPAALLPMQVTGSTVLTSSSALGPGQVEIATGAVTAGSTVWLAEGGMPLLVESLVGGGVVEMATFDWTQDSITAWSGTAALLRQALVRSTYGNSNGNSPGGPVMTKFGSSTSIANKGGALTNVLGNLPSLGLPAWWLIGALVLVYVLLVGPVNYFVLRALNRRALAWITVPAIALVGSAGAYGASVATKGTAVLANEIAILHVHQGWERAYQEEYTGILTPTRGDYEVGLGARHTMVSPIYYYSGAMNDPNFGAMRVNTTTQAVTLPGMTAFTLRGFADEGIVVGPQLTGSTQLTAGKLTGTLRNLSALHFTDGIVFFANSFQKLGELGPNGNVSFSYQVVGGNSLGGPPIFITAYPNALNGNPLNNASDVERENEMRTAVLSTLMGNYGPVTSPFSLPTVVLWTKQPFQAVTVNGGQPRTFSESAVVMPLPLGPISGTVPSAVVAGRIVDIDADVSQGGMPGLIAAQGGSITYSFTPTLAPGKRLTGAALDSTNPFGAKGAIAPNGTVGVAKGKVWDWSSSTWVDIAYQDTSSTPIPDSAVNPKTGEVRFKLSSDGSFSSTWLSLSGGVA